MTRGFDCHLGAVFFIRQFEPAWRFSHTTRFDPRVTNLQANLLEKCLTSVGTRGILRVGEWPMEWWIAGEETASFWEVKLLLLDSWSSGCRCLTGQFQDNRYDNYFKAL